MRKIVLVGLLGLGFLPSRAQAAVIMFDHCTEASLCNQMYFVTLIQPGGEFQGTLVRGLPIGPGGIGINVFPDVTVTFGFPAVTSFLGPGPVGPYGFFSERWGGPFDHPYNTTATFLSPDGTFPDDLAPFFLNAEGFFMAAHLIDPRTGMTGYVAGQLNDVQNVPEPGTLLLCATGLAMIARRARAMSGRR